tara:strand:+ start:174 stop:569 length:396 start_codon:yes stop_codon:yes gene_type:complete
MTSKRIKKKKTSFVALLLLFKNIEKELSKNKQYPKRTSSSGVTYKKRERERNKTRGRWLLVIFSVFRVRKKKIRALRMKRKHNNKQAKKKKNDKTNRRLLLLCKTETLYTHFGGFIHSQEEKRALVVFFFV